MRRRFANGCEKCRRREGEKRGLTLCAARREENGPLIVLCSECYWQSQPSMAELEANDIRAKEMVEVGVFVERKSENDQAQRPPQ